MAYRRNRIFGLFGLSVACILMCVFSTGVAARDDGESFDIFDALQENVWYLPTDDHQALLYVTSFGHGPTVIVLHGGPGNDFNYLVDALRPLADRYRFVLFDQRGSVLSPMAEKDIGGLNMDKLVADIETLRRALGEDKVALFGHSFGTMLAMWYFKAHPDHVAGLALAASAPPDMPSFGAYLKELHKREDALRSRVIVDKTIAAAGIPAKGNAALSAQQRSDLLRIHNAAIDTVHVDRWQTFQGGGVYYNDKVDDAIGGSLPDTYSILPALLGNPIPVTVIQGDQDYIDPAGAAWTDAVAQDPNVMIEVIKDASHYSWIDDPRTFSHDLDAALKRIPKPDGRSN